MRLNCIYVKTVICLGLANLNAAFQFVPRNSLPFQRHSVGVNVPENRRSNPSSTLSMIDKSYLEGGAVALAGLVVGIGGGNHCFVRFLFVDLF